MATNRYGAGRAGTAAETDPAAPPKVDIREDPGAKAFVRSVADGNEMVPTVVVAGRALVNPSKREVLGAVRAYAPHALGEGCLANAMKSLIRWQSANSRQ